MFNEIRLKRQLSSLPVSHCVAFAAACCERLIPNYSAFYQMEKWGEPALLRRALDQVWSILIDDSASKGQVVAFMQACMTIAPDTEDFSSLFVSAAGDAVASVIYTLECYVSKDIGQAAIVGRLAFETLYQYLHIVNDPNVGFHMSDSSFDEWIIQSPLITAEEKKQQEDLELLKSFPIVNERLLEDLRNSSIGYGINPFKRGLLKTTL